MEIEIEAGNMSNINQLLSFRGENRRIRMDSRSFCIIP